MKDDAKLTRAMTVVALIVLCAALLMVPVYSWLALGRVLGAYAPIAKPEALYVGAGHRDYDETNQLFTSDHFEDIRYLYLNGIDVNEDQGYYDYVFCIFGKAIHYYRLQLAYTTNNQFEYELYRATETTTYQQGAVEYVTHEDVPRTFYYYTDNSRKIQGTFLNRTVVGGEAIADSTLHNATYGDGDGGYSNVQKYAEPIYWQSSTSDKEPGNSDGDFINYYILRVKMNGKAANDRETDVICIAAKAG